MKQSVLRIDYSHLLPLNEYLGEILPHPISKSQDKMEPLAPAQIHVTVYSADDDLEKMLDFVPSDYHTLSNLLQDNLNIHLQHQTDQDEEVKGGESIPHSQEKEEDIFLVCKEHIISTKLHEAYSKALDRLAHLA